MFPAGFVIKHLALSDGQKLIIDEAQYAPEMFSYIQTIVDEKKENGLYILTGSQNFLKPLICGISLIIKEIII